MQKRCEWRSPIVQTKKCRTIIGEQQQKAHKLVCWHIVAQTISSAQRAKWFKSFHKIENSLGNWECAETFNQFFADARSVVKRENVATLELQKICENWKLWLALTLSNLSLFFTCCATKLDASIVFSISL